MPRASPIDVLLAEDRWIRRLAGRLVVDPHTADDLAQDAYLTALASADRPREARAWLGGILRNLWRDLARSGARRAHREEHAARPEATASTDELVAEVELRKHVAELVLALEEPLRRALILRFFQERTLAAVARSEGISVSTAHERVERGLARLRAQLDSEHRGERRAWAVGLAALATRRVVAPALTGGMLMGTAVKVALLVLGALAWYALGREPGEELPPAPAPTVLVDAPSESPAPEERPALRESAASAPAVDTSASGPGSAALGASVRGRVLAPDGSPLAGIPVGLLLEPFTQEHGQDHGPTTASAEDGSFELALPAGQVLMRPIDLDPGRTLLAVELRAVEEGPDEWQLTLTGCSAYAGEVVDEAGAPIEGARVRVELDSTYLREHGLLRLMDMQPQREATSDALGRFALPPSPAGDGVALRVSAAGFRMTCLSAQGQEQALRVVLRRESEDVPHTGVVHGPDGAPVAGARVATLFDAATSAADGTFTVLWHSAAIHPIGLPDGSTMRCRETHLTATKAGLRPAYVALAELDLAAPLVLRLEPELRIRGQVVDARGEPLANAQVWVSDPTPLGTFAGGSTTQCVPLSVESFEGDDPGCSSAADGRFELGQLLAREYRVMAFEPRTASFGGPWLVAAGSDGVELVLDPEPGRVRVAGRLVTADGAPLAGAMLVLQRLGPGGLTFGGGETTTDPEGRFEFPAVVLAGTQLTCFHEIHVHSVLLEGLGDPEHLEIVLPRLGEVQVELADPALANRARFLDGDGRELAALQFDSNAVTVHVELRLSQGRSDVVQLAESARTLVLYQDGQEVLRFPVHVDPARRTTLRP